MLKRIDDGLARGEAALAGVFLIAMIVLAAVQVVVDNSAVRFELVWAQEARTHLAWIDSFLKRATVVLAFLGASLAVHHNKHIAVDALLRVFPPRVRVAVRGLSMALAGVICFFLARVFFQAAIDAAAADAAQRALDVYLLGNVHVCDGAPDALAEASLDRPDLFCGVRSALANIGLTREMVRGGETLTVPAIDVPEALLRFVVPSMLLVMSARFVARGLEAILRVARGEVAGLDPAVGAH